MPLAICLHIGDHRRMAGAFVGATIDTAPYAQGQRIPGLCELANFAVLGAKKEVIRAILPLNKKTCAKTR